MTGKEQDELGRLQAAHDYELIEYVESLLDRAREEGYDRGHADGYTLHGMNL